jgi:hypothetical protein
MTEAAAAIDVASPLLHTGREASTAAVSSGRKITQAGALPARREMVYAQHLVGSALDRLCELDGARWVYDSDQLGANPARRDDHPDPPRREPPGRDGALRPHAARPRPWVTPATARRLT